MSHTSDHKRDWCGASPFGDGIQRIMWLCIRSKASMENCERELSCDDWRAKSISVQITGRSLTDPTALLTNLLPSQSIMRRRKSDMICITKMHFWTAHHPEARRGKEEVLSVLSWTTVFFSLFEAAVKIKTYGLSCRVLSYCTYSASEENKPDTYTCGNETLSSCRENNTSLSCAFVRLSEYHKNAHTPLLYVQKTPHLLTFYQPAL